MRYFSVVILLLLLISCRKDIVKGINEDYFFQEPRNVLLSEDFNNNNNNWKLNIDSANYSLSYPYAYYDTICDSYAKIEDGMLQLKGANGNFSRASLDFEKFDFTNSKYIGIEIHFRDDFVNEFYGEDYHSVGEYFDLFIDEIRVYKYTGNFGYDNINILFNPYDQNILFSINNKKAFKSNFFYKYEALGVSNRFVISSSHYFNDLEGYESYPFNIYYFELYTL